MLNENATKIYYGWCAICTNSAITTTSTHQSSTIHQFSFFFFSVLYLLSTHLYISLITTPIHFHQRQIFELLYCHHQPRCCNHFYSSPSIFFRVRIEFYTPLKTDLPNQHSLIRVPTSTNTRERLIDSSPDQEFKATRFIRAIRLV